MSATTARIARGESPGRRALRRFARHRLAMLGLAVIVIFAAIALLAPWIAPYDPIATSWSRIRKPPSELYWFGTDENGRDIFSRIVGGARASLMVGVVSVVAAVCSSACPSACWPGWPGAGWMR